MKKYRSHKEVWADKIMRVDPAPKGEGGFLLYLKDSPNEYVPQNFYARGGPHEDDLGYLVKYEDGYKSWSPTKPFEDGYTEVTQADPSLVQANDAENGSMNRNTVT